MRIISGKFKRKTIFPPKNFKARPTTDMAKESLFNVLQNTYEIDSLKILDLFSGTGSIAYEFASRGCDDVTAVELNFNHFNFIKETIKELKIENEMRVIKSNAIVFIRRIKEKYDLIFADPPYDLKDLDKLPDEIFDNELLNKQGLLILEHPENYSFTKHKYFTLHKKYGSVNFSFFEIDS